LPFGVLLVIQILFGSGQVLQLSSSWRCDQKIEIRFAVVISASGSTLLPTVSFLLLLAAYEQLQLFGTFHLALFYFLSQLVSAEALVIGLDLMVVRQCL